MNIALTFIFTGILVAMLYRWIFTSEGPLFRAALVLFILMLFVYVSFLGGVYYSMGLYKLFFFSAPIVALYVYIELFLRNTREDILSLALWKVVWRPWVYLLPIWALLVLLALFVPKFLLYPHVDSYWFIDSALNNFYSLWHEARWVLHILAIKQLTDIFPGVAWVIYLPSLMLFFLFYGLIVFSYKQWLLWLEKWWLLYLLLIITLFPLQLYLLFMVRDYVDSEALFFLIALLTVWAVRAGKYRYFLAALSFTCINAYINPKDILFSTYAIGAIVFLTYQITDYKYKNRVALISLFAALGLGLSFGGWEKMIAFVSHISATDSSIFALKKDFLNVFSSNSYIRFLFLDGNQIGTANVWLTIVGLVVVCFAFIRSTYTFLYRPKEITIVDYLVLFNVLFVLFIQVSLVWVQWARMMRYVYLSEIFLLIVTVTYIYNIFSRITTPYIRNSGLILIFFLFVNPLLYKNLYAFSGGWSPFGEYNMNGPEVLSTVPSGSIVIEGNQWPKYLHDDFRALGLLKNNFVTINLPQEVLKNGATEYAGTNKDREKVFFSTILKYRNTDRDIYFYIEYYHMGTVDCDLIVPCRVQKYIASHFTLVERKNGSLLYRYTKK